MASDGVCPGCGVYLTRPYIKCAECRNPERSFCLQCFSHGLEYEMHKKTHGYIVMRDNFPIFEKNWMASEELKLLDAILANGLGNWVAVAKAVGTKSKEECERHYFAHYINNPQPPLPKLSDVEVDEIHPTPVLFAGSTEPPRPALFSTMYNEMAGYMPARGDFCYEYDDNAEYDIKDVDFEEKDPVLIELQNAVLSNYRFRLQERYRRKAFIKRYGLISAQKNLQEWRRYHVLGKDVLDNLKPMMRLFQPKQFDEFMEGILCEENIKRRIKLLQECRKSGVTKLQDISTYVKFKKNHEGVHKTKTTLDEVLPHLKSEESRKSFIRKQALKEGASAVVPISTRRSAPPLVISGMPGYDALTERERNLCASIRLLPSAYLQYKATLLHEYNKLGSLRLANARAVIKIDVNKTRKIYDFLLDEGIISQ